MDRYVFFGDSIVAGMWMRYVFDYYTRKAGIKCRMYNAGVSGDAAGMAPLRIDEHVVARNPTHVVIAFGMNGTGFVDVNSVSPERLTNAIATAETIAGQIDGIAKTVVEKTGAKIIFCTTTPYDIFQAGCDWPCHTRFERIVDLNKRVKALAAKYDAKVVPFFRDLLTAQMKAVDKGNTFIGDDRVHPNDYGRYILGESFIRAMGFDIDYTDDFNEVAARVEKWNAECGDAMTKLLAVSSKIANLEFPRYNTFPGMTDEERFRKIDEFIAAKRAWTPWVEQRWRDYKDNIRFYDDWKAERDRLTDIIGG